MIIKLLTLIPDNTKIDFFGHRFYAYAVTAIVILGSIFFVATKGLNLGIDFTGGTVMEVQMPQQPDMDQLRSSLHKLDMGDISIQQFGSPLDLMIRLPQQAGGPEAQKAAIEKLKATLNAQYQDGKIDYRRVEFVGPQVGEELKKDGIMAILFSTLAIVAYISFRFEWQYGIGAVVALIHDIVGTMGLFAVTQMQFDLSTLAAVLLISGYSINDTVIIFDRIRENLRKYKKMPLPELINLSINQTLPRTLMTSSATLLSLLALWLFGGDVIRGFITALFFGIAIGTHSSIFVASPLLVYLRLRPAQNADGKEATV
jgi:preprotein translocase SecF subunit